uniref:Natterin-4 n=1 Tax=Anabas testudineus TaxID=64144 RepID=A0A3Q1JI61_ANATE
IPYLSFPNLKNTNLLWQNWRGSLPNGAVGIHNSYTGRRDYVCKYGCEAGFYSPSLGPHCRYAYSGKEKLGSPFSILVNSNNFELLEWKEGSYGSVPQNSINTLQHRWDTSFSITAGVKSSITAKIPIIGSTGIEFSTETTKQFSKGTTVVESHSHSVSLKQDVPPNHTCAVSMLGYKYKADIPFTARLKRTYSNGKTTWKLITGTYDSVEVGEVRAVVDRCEPIPDAKPCRSHLK